MKNTIVEGHEAEDIEKQVSKILRGLGNPEPPLSLDDVRELLRLDRQFYSSSDQSAVREVVSRMIVAGKQVIMRPTILFDVIRKARISALWLPDKKRILIDRDIPELKHRWNEAHEVGHSIIPWHDNLLLGDNEFSLNPNCHEQMEAEANFAAGQLLFLQDRFVTEAKDLEVSLRTVKQLKEGFGNTYSSTLWRYIENVGGDEPMLGLISAHPKRLPEDFDSAHPCRHFIQSPGFQRRFSSTTEVMMFAALKSYYGYQRGGPLGEDDVVIQDDNGSEHLFHFESFSKKYDVLTLGRYLRRCRMTVVV